jgi:thiamine biosynthesis lipoprotein
MTNRAVAAAFATIKRVQARMSYHDSTSELSQLNRWAVRRPTRVSRPVATVLRAALSLARATDGAFDPTIAPVLAGWGLLPRLPTRTGAERAATWRDVEVSPTDFVSFRTPLHLDLGGIAKGFAVDRAINSLRNAGIRSALVNAGGDLRAFGPRAWPILVRDPSHPGAPAAKLSLRNAALATSAHYFSRRPWRGRLVSALVDGRVRRPQGEDGRSVTVQAPRAMMADALTKVVFALGVEAKGILNRHSARALVLGDDRAVEIGG